MRIFLTGGTGLLGSHFVEIATTEGADVVSLVRPNSDTAYLNALGITLATGSLQDVASLASGMKGCDAVVHAASPIGGWGKPDRYEESTIGGTRNRKACCLPRAFCKNTYRSCSVTGSGFSCLAMPFIY